LIQLAALKKSDDVKVDDVLECVLLIECVL